MRKSVIWGGILSALLLVLAAGCATSGPQAPEWVSQYPRNPNYYIGIGSSQTGVMAEDTELAKARALNSLAGEISTEIRSSTTYREVDDGQSSSRTAEQEINAVVAQNLQAVETMDSFYSQEAGAWYYVRLNKEEWAAIQRREMEAINRRVMDRVEPVLKDPGRSLSEALGALAAGWEIVAASPYTGMIRTSLMGAEGSLIDLLEKRIAAEIAQIRIEVDPEETAVEIGRPARFSFSVSHPERTRIGQVTLDLVDEAGEGTVLLSLVTSPRGEYDEPVNLQNLTVGKNYLAAKLNLATMGIDPARFRISPPQRDLLVDLQQLKAQLDVGFGGDVEDPAALTGVGGSVRAFFTNQLPVKIVSDGEDSSYDIAFNLQYRNAPPNDYGLVIIYVKANVAVTRDGRNVFTFESPEYKGGGLNWSQANTKALEKLFPALEEDPRFTQEITGAFALD